MMKYFISFVYQDEDKQFGFGNHEIETTKEIKSIKDIELIQSELKKKYSSGGLFAIMNFQRLDLT